MEYISVFISFGLNYDGNTIDPGEVRRVTLTLRVDGDCPALSGFGFDIVIVGS